MYYDYFGLKQPPFRITPDTSLFYPGGDRGAVLDALVYAILNGEGMVKVVGEVGSGKTMLCRMLEKELPDKVEVVYLANPSLSPENILQAIAFELKLPVQPDTARLQVMHNLHEYLLERHAENRQVVVFVEEAQAMPVATQEEIRLLSNLETQQSKLLQIALFGQPELDVLLANPEIRQLKERITYSFQLNPFVSEHIRDYVNTRLRASGYRAGEVFNQAAIRKIEHYSRGLLRRVNILADKSLLAAYAGNTNEVTAKHVEQAAQDSEFVMRKSRFLWIALISASILFVLLVLIGYWSMAFNGGDRVFGAKEQTSPNSLAESDSKAVTPTAAQGRATQNRQLVTGAAQQHKLASTGGADTSVVKGGIINPRTKKKNIDETKAYVITEQELRLNLDDSIEQISDREPTILIHKKSEAEKIAHPVPVLAEENTVQGKKIAGQLLDLSILFELQDLGDARLSSQESALLRHQLKELPPEVALYQDSAQFSDICKLCWSILYRPLVQPENL